MKTLYLCILGLFCFAASSPATAQMKIGYINSAVLKEKLPEFQAAQKQLVELQQAREKELEERRMKMAQMQETFSKQAMLMSDTKKAEMAAEFQKKEQDLQEFFQKTFSNGGELMQKEIELSAPIFEKINGVLESLGKEEGYDIIFDATAPGNNIVYVKPEHELTDKLMARLMPATTE